MVTVRQALEVWPLTQAQLLAGADGLDNLISWTHIVEVFDDPYFLSPGILLCSTGYGFKHDPRLQTSVMKEASRVGVAAFLMKTGYELKTIPEEMLAAADAAGIPFLKFPQNIPFSDVTRAMAALLLQAEAQSFRRARQMLRRLMDTHSSGGGFDAVARVLGEALDCTAFVTNRPGDMLATHLGPGVPEGDALDTPALSAVAHLGHYSQKIGSTAGTDRLFRLNRIVALPRDRAAVEASAFIAPIRFEGRMRGFVGVITDAGMTDLTLWSIETAAMVAAAEYRTLRVRESTEQRLAGNLLDALLGDQDAEDAHVSSRLAAWGYDTAKPCRVVLVEVDPAQGTGRKAFGPEELRPLLGQFCGDGRYEPIVRLHGSKAVALKQVDASMPAREDQDLADLQGRISRRLGSAPVWTVMGRPVRLDSVSGLRDAYEEATRAMKVVRQTRPQGGALSAEDLGLDNILLDLAGSSRALAYVTDVLGPVLEHRPEQSRTRLLETLRAYLAAGADVRRTSEDMFLHANTVRYRLRKVETLTGRSLRSSADRTLLTVALRLVELGAPLPIGTT